PGVRLVGWVPSVLPYLERARLAVVPVLHGAGTKRKVIQALMVGTPTVTTMIGAEGLELRNGEHALIADEPAEFAAHVSHLVMDDELAIGLASRGRSHVLAAHSRDSVRGQLEHAIAAVMHRPPKKLSVSALAALSAVEPTDDEYQQLGRRVRRVLLSELPIGARVTVVSKGDDALLDLDGMQTWHFPRAKTGQYAGYYPADSAEAIAQLEAQRVAGIQFLVFPRTA